MMLCDERPPRSDIRLFCDEPPLSAECARSHDAPSSPVLREMNWQSTNPELAEKIARSGAVALGVFLDAPYLAALAPKRHVIDKAGGTAGKGAKWPTRARRQ